MIKYEVIYSNSFKKDIKKIQKQGKNLSKINHIINKLSCGEALNINNRDHQLIDNKYYKNCRECHIEPDWLLVYQILNNELILLLVRTGSHSELLD